MIEKSIILIPTLHEKDNLEKLIPAIFNLMADVSILVVDDDSKDGTPELVSSMSARFKNLYLLSRENDHGYGRSSIDGFKFAIEKGYGAVITMDADFSHDLNAVPAMLEKLKYSDVVVGSRYIHGGGVKNWNLMRRILSRFANFYVKLLLNLPVKDATTGFNAYRIEALQKLKPEDIRSEGYAFLVETKFNLSKAGCRFSEYPIIFSERREGRSKMSTKIIWESVWLPWKLRLNRK